MRDKLLWRLHPRARREGPKLRRCPRQRLPCPISHRRNRVPYHAFRTSLLHRDLPRVIQRMLDHPVQQVVVIISLPRHRGVQISLLHHVQQPFRRKPGPLLRPLPIPALRPIRLTQQNRGVAPDPPLRRFQPRRHMQGQLLNRMPHPTHLRLSLRRTYSVEHFKQRIPMPCVPIHRPPQLI